MQQESSREESSIQKSSGEESSREDSSRRYQNSSLRESRQGHCQDFVSFHRVRVHRYFTSSGSDSEEIRIYNPNGSSSLVVTERLTVERKKGYRPQATTRSGSCGTDRGDPEKRPQIHTH